MMMKSFQDFFLYILYWLLIDKVVEAIAQLHLSYDLQECLAKDR